MMKKLLYVIFLIGSIFSLLILSYNKNDKNSDDKTKTTKKKFSELFNLEQEIQLETTEIGLIGNPRFMKKFKDMIFIIDYISRDVLIFNIDGTYIRKLSTMGNGPHEYLRPVALDIDNSNDIYLLDDEKNVILIFNENCKFEKKIEVDVSGYSDIRVENDFIYLLHGYKRNLEGEMISVVDKMNGQVCKKIINIKNIIDLPERIKPFNKSYFVVNKEYIYYNHLVFYNICKYNISGDFVQVFDRKNPYYIPLPKEHMKMKFSKIYESFTPFAGLFLLYERYLIAQLKLNPEQYIIDIYDLNGNLINMGLSVPEKIFLCDNNLLYTLSFQKTTDLDDTLQNPIIRIYSFKQTKLIIK